MQSGRTCNKRQVRVPGVRTFMQNCVKKMGAHLPRVVNHKLWHGQMCVRVCPTTPVHSGCSTRLVAYVLLVGEAVLGGNHALVKAELLAGAVVAAKEREHSVEHGPRFVNLVRLVHSIVCLIDQVQEAQEGNESVMLHAHDKVVASPLPIALIPHLDHIDFHLIPQAKESLAAQGQRQA